MDYKIWFDLVCGNLVQIKDLVFHINFISCQCPHTRSSAASRVIARCNLSRIIPFETNFLGLQWNRITRLSLILMILQIIAKARGDSTPLRGPIHLLCRLMGTISTSLVLIRACAAIVLWERGILWILFLTLRATNARKSISLSRSSPSSSYWGEVVRLLPGPGNQASGLGCLILWSNLFWGCWLGVKWNWLKNKKCLLYARCTEVWIYY